MFDDDTFNGRLFFPRAEVTTPPAGAVDVDIDVPGAVLHLRVHAADGAGATVLLFHGNGEVVADYDDAAAQFAGAGAALAVADFRGYGRSTGTSTLRDAIDDAPAVLDALAARVASPIVVMGRSLGSFCAHELYAGGRGDVVGFVLESGASDLRALVRRRGLQPPAAFDPADVRVFDPLPKLRRGTQPLLVLHGEDDALIDADEARAAFAAAGTDAKELVLVPGRGHNDLSASPVYWRALAAFVRGCTGG